jgi:hypothetical protein
MEARIGTCGSCNAKFKVPATFTADKAKCKKCGGVVTFEARAEPAAQPAPKAVPVPARVPSAKPAAPAPAPAAAAPAPRLAVAATAKPAGDALRTKVAATAARVQASSASQAAPATATKAAAGASTATASRGAQRAGQRAHEPSSRAGRRTESKRKSKQVTPGMIVGMVVVLVALVAGGFFLFGRGGDKAANAAEGGTNTAGLGEPGRAAAPQQPAPAPEATPEAPAEETAQKEPAKEDVAAPAKPVKPVEPEQVVLLDLVAELPELEPVAGTDPALVEEMKGWMAEYVDPFSGAAGSRAGKRLQEQGKAAFPIIINAFRRLDFTTEDGFRAGDLTQKLLERICNGRNFDWHYPASGTDVLEPKDVLFNQKVVRNWYNIWIEAKDDEAKWLKLIKKDGAPEGEGDAAAKPAKKLDDF